MNVILKRYSLLERELYKYFFLSNHDNNIRPFGTRCSRIFTTDDKTGGICTVYHGSSFFIASVCNLLGSTCFKLKRFDECLSYLNWANRNLTNSLQNDGDSSCSGKCVMLTLLNCHQDLFEVKAAMGRIDEVFIHAKKILEINEQILEKGCIELGYCNKAVADAYLKDHKYGEALPFALKAIRIYMKHVGDDSDELAQVRKNLGIIYGALGEYDKALELTRLSLSALKSMDHRLTAQMEVANMLLALGKNDEAIEACKSLLPLAETEGNHQVRACSFTYIANGFFNMGKFSDAKKYLKIARRVLEKKQINPYVVAILFEEMSGIYEKMKDNESAILFLRRALAIPELPQKNLIDSSTRLFFLFYKNHKDKKGFSYLEEVVDRLKEKLGPEHSQVGYGYNILGVSYLRSYELETAAECFVRAQDVFEVSLGPHHVASLRARQFLAMIYADTKRTHQAIEIQEKVVVSLRGLGRGPSENKFLDEAVKLLSRMKARVADFPTGASPQPNYGEDASAMISKCGISDDGKEIK